MHAALGTCIDLEDGFASGIQGCIAAIVEGEDVALRISSVSDVERLKLHSTE